MMGCEALLDVPWNWASDEMVAEIANQTALVEFKGTIRVAAKKWNEAKVAAGLRINQKGPELLPRSNKEAYMGYFDRDSNNSEG
jgi:hypothetical protein